MILGRTVSRCLAVTLIASLLPIVGSAQPKSVNPETIHRKVVERGTGNWIRVDTKNGTTIVGRITSMGEQSFGIELEKYLEPTVIAYSDVQRVGKAGSKGRKLALSLGIGAAGTVAMALVAQSQMSSMNSSQPTVRNSARR